MTTREEFLRATRQRLAWMGSEADPVVRDLAARLDHCVQRWDLALGEIYGAGVGPPVLSVTADATTAGRPAALKLGWGPDFDQQVAVLRASNGNGYVRVLDEDAEQSAVLLERLGQPLSRSGLTPIEQCDVLVDLLQAAWSNPHLANLPGIQAVDKAAGLRQILAAEGHRAEAHTAEAADLLATADAVAATLTARGTRPVVVHGDPHPQNALARADGWALIDPDGFGSDAAYDLGVIARGWADEICAADDGAAWLRTLCQHMGQRCDIDPSLIFDWAFVERVTTGLWLAKFGQPDAADYLRTAVELLSGFRRTGSTNSTR